MPAEVVHTAAPQDRIDFQSARSRGSFRSLFLQANRVLAGPGFSRGSKMTPAGVSLLAGIFGVVAGHLYFYRDLSINVAGMVLHVCANASR